MSATHPESDKKAAFMGLIFGALAVLAILYTVVHFTNAKYASHGEKAAAEASH